MESLRHSELLEEEERCCNVKEEVGLSKRISQRLQGWIDRSIAVVDKDIEGFAERREKSWDSAEGCCSRRCKERCSEDEEGVGVLDSRCLEDVRRAVLRKREVSEARERG